EEAHQRPRPGRRGDAPGHGARPRRHAPPAARERRPPAGRRPRSGESGPRLRRRLRARARPRGLRRAGDARRGVRRLRLHQPHPGSDAGGDQGRGRGGRGLLRRQELHGRRAQLRDGRGAGRGRGRPDRLRGDKRRRGGRGLDVHQRQARDLGHHLRAQDLRRGRRRRQGPKGDQGVGGEGQRQRPLDGDGANELYPARERGADLPDRRRRDGDRHRHPRRTRHRTQKHRTGRRRGGPDARQDPRRLRGLLRFRGRGDGKRHGRHPAHGALHSLRPGRRPAWGRGRERVADAVRRGLHDLAGDGRLLHHAAQARRGDEGLPRGPVRRPGREAIL
ncbi:MAG: Phosphoenolpyruvate-dihydroxyacetone phosphotransferase, dihydroxyacetone binding subunit DhaK, partial [uncultured Rubrobacteraceae bacterium]